MGSIFLGHPVLWEIDSEACVRRNDVVLINAVFPSAVKKISLEVQQTKISLVFSNALQKMIHFL